MHWYSFIPDWLQDTIHWLYVNTPGNIAASLIWVPLAVLGGALWAKTKFFPLNYLSKARIHGLFTAVHERLEVHHQEAMSHHERQTEMIEEMHRLAHTGEVHPRAAARYSAGEPPDTSLEEP